MISDNLSDSEQYRQWMRDRFPALNKRIDDGLQEALPVLIEESTTIRETLVRDEATNERERFTYLSMVHSALYHHKKRAALLKVILPSSFDKTFSNVEQAMVELATKIGVEHRFLSVFYLFHNPEIPDMHGKFAQFRPSQYETAFIRVNREGTMQYKLAATALFNAFNLLQRGIASLDAIAPLLSEAASAFYKIAHGNSMLLKTPGGEEFKSLTQYFGEVEVAGKTLRGVNAGDQPWSYIIDLLLGVDLKHVFEHAFENTPAMRHYPPEVRTSADVVAHEFQSGEYLRPNYLLPEDYEYLRTVLQKMNSHPSLISTIQALFSLDDQIELARILHRALKHYLGASNVHYQLASRFVPMNPQGEQIGSAGTHIVQFLKEGLNAEREKVKSMLETKYHDVLHNKVMEPELHD